MKKGFTLIELMVVVAIIGTIAGVTMTSESFFKQRSSTKLGTTQLFNVLRQARVLAIISRQNICVSVDRSNKVVQLTSCNSGSNQTNINAISDPNQKARAQALFDKLSIFDGLSIESETIQFHGGDSSEDPAVFVFNPRGMFDSSGHFVRTISFKFPNEEDYKIIELSIAGSMRMCERDISAGSCR